MGNKSILWSVLFTVICQGSCITISSNGNSPDVKILSIDKKSIEFGGFVPINPHLNTHRMSKSTMKQKSYLNSTNLPVNERYRRLIPYMTFYLANDFNDPQNEIQPAKVPLQKIAIPNNVITQNTKSSIQYSKVPHYQGNRLTQFNIASSYPDKISQDYYYNTEYSKYINHNLQSDPKYLPIKSVMRPPPKSSVYDFQRPIPVPVKVSNYNSDYFVKSIEPKQQYKLIPYEQTPPVHVPELDESADYFESKKYNYYKEEKPVYTHDQSYKYTPEVETYQSYDQSKLNIEKDYKEDSKYNAIPTMSTGFKPIFPSYVSPISNTKVSHFNTIPYSQDVSIESNSGTTSKPLYYKSSPIYTSPSIDYVTKAPEMNYGPSSTDQFEQNNLASILKSLQASNSLPKTITTDNVDSSIKTLVKILKNLKSNHKYVELSTIKPIISSPLPFQPAIKALPHPKAILTPFIPSKKIVSLTKPTVSPVLLHEYPPQDLEHVVEAPIHGTGSSHSYPSDANEVGGTPGKLGIDYPALATIPKTSFDCKTQRYKGFFGDPETNCQVWHYCDLNGGQASFLCPNGTIFSQVALTCDWWFNVKCSTTTQLYVLNERLYKYILPFNPKFPEDYSGPLVDKYLAIKYKELEEKMKKKKKISKPEPSLEMQKVDVIEIKTSGMSGALKPYNN